MPFTGFKGDYQSTQVVTPTANGFPWLAQVVGSNFVNRPTGATYTMLGGDVPQVLLHLDHPSRRVRFEAFDADTGKAQHVVSNDEYVTRHSTPVSFFVLAWDGQTFTGKGKNGNQIYTVPNGLSHTRYEAAARRGSQAVAARYGGRPERRQRSSERPGR